MKPWVKVLLGVFGGFAGGFVAGFFTHKKMNDVEFEEVDEIEMSQLEKKVQAEEQSKPVPNVLKDEDLATDPDALRKQLQGKKSYIEADREAKERYSDIWKTVKGYSDDKNANEMPVVEDMDDGIDQDFINEALDEEEEDLGKVKPPYPIDLPTFYNERNDYDKITIMWYEPNTFLDEKEEIIADISIHDLFKDTEANEDPDIRFVRNEEYSTDYEIVRRHKSWTEEVGETGGSE